MSSSILFLAKLKGRSRSFPGGCKKRGHILRLIPSSPQENLVVIRDEKVSPFVKFEIMLTPFVDSRLCQKQRILLSSRQRSNNYLELSKENALENMMLPHSPCFTLKFFMVCFIKLLD